MAYCTGPMSPIYFARSLIAAGVMCRVVAHRSLHVLHHIAFCNFWSFSINGLFLGYI